MPHGKAVTGKPVSHYEPFVELVAVAIANGIANLPEWVRDGTLNLRAPIEQQTRPLAESFIEWRGAFLIDDALAQTQNGDPK